MIELIQMCNAHIDQVAALEQCCFSAPWSANALRSELSNPLAYWLVAWDGERVAGYIGSQTVMGEADMMNVAVAPDCRRQGLAEKLVRRLIEDLNVHGVKCLTLEVRASNEPAIALYKKIGFGQVGRRPNYYRNPREDALILRKEW